MYILRRLNTFWMLCGCSRPTSWTSPTKKFLYTVYTIFLLLTIHSFLLTQILDLVLVVDNQDDFGDNFYVTMSMLVTCCKLNSMLITRENILGLLNTLEGEPFLPVNDEELEIRTKCDRITEWNAMAYSISLLSCVTWMFLMPVIMEYENRKLTFRVWLPFDYTSAGAYCLAFSHQLLAAIICCVSAIACDGLFSGLLVHIYSQFETLGNRLRNIHRDENDSVKQCVRHHDEIYKFAGMVNQQFEGIMLIQFLTSTAAMCFDLYRLTQKDFDLRVVDVLLFMFCTLIQIFYYCWYGNEVKLKSLEVPGMVFESDWLSLSNRSKKSLLMIMGRASVPIEFTSIYFLSMDLESFKALLKISYSAFNLLQQTR